MPNPMTLLEQVAEMERRMKSNLWKAEREDVRVILAKLREVVEAAQHYLYHPHDNEGINLAAVDRLQKALTPMPSE